MFTSNQQQLAVSLITCVLSFGGGGSAQVKQSPPAPAAPRPQTASTPASEAAPTDATLIQPGRSVGLLCLGDTRQRVLELFPNKPNYDEQYSYGEPCPSSEIHWLDIDPSKENGPVYNGLFIYLRGGRVFQIEAATPRFRTANGITEGSSPEDVRRRYPQLHAYVLLNSGTEVEGGRDLIYWVDSQSGIAFEFQYDNKTRNRYVSKVIVFEPGSEFQPEGCVQPQQEWRGLGPFALEPLTSEGKPKK